MSEYIQGIYLGKGHVNYQCHESQCNNKQANIRSLEGG